MQVIAIKTDRVQANSTSLLKLLDTFVTDFSEGSILLITSKVVSLCEGRVLPIESSNKNELIKKESDFYLPGELSKYGYHFSIVRNTLIAAAGIDESNGGGNFVLWPKDPQQTANDVRVYLKERFNLKKVGVIITDSTCMPLRRGTHGIALGYSGFRALNDYIGKPDLFGRPFDVSQASVAEGLAASGVLAMGEGKEQTPVAIISDVPFVHFQDRNPTADELAYINMDRKDDLFEPFLSSVDWQPGKRTNK